MDRDQISRINAGIKILGVVKIKGNGPIGVEGGIISELEKDLGDFKKMYGDCEVEFFHNTGDMDAESEELDLDELHTGHNLPNETCCVFRLSSEGDQS